MLQKLRVLRWLLLLEDSSDLTQITTADEDYLLRKSIQFLNRGHESSKQRKFEAKLYLAAHLSPRAALQYDTTNPTPRYELIQEYLYEEYGLQGEEIETLSRRIQKLLDAWESDRDNVTNYRQRLLSEQDGKCASCNVELNSTPKTAQINDQYKPYLDKPDRRTSPEVDHISSVSTFGTNDYDNLQVLCRLCNHGKGKGLGVDPVKEIEHAGKTINYAPWSHRASMMYFVLERDNFTCKECSESEHELTVRPISESGGYLRSNLKTICVECL
ncbi:HNH endonuclease [Salinibacter sp.]|uniref:HNH endonuclease n=1 Tax=Salinibacter sp. TaxID=2065818 RepID=UPI0021E7E3AD|nr:HNH endonuclease [Salinibacter sp.]